MKKMKHIFDAAKKGIIDHMNTSIAAKYKKIPTKAETLENEPSGMDNPTEEQQETPTIHLSVHMGKKKRN